MTAARPNIVFVFADDWGWGDLGCYGHPQVQTPHLDRLAQQGVLYTQFYVCSGVCSPSRAAVMTGRFPARLGIHGHFADHELNASRGMPNSLDPAVPTYTRLLQQAGYAVGHYGKWHLGHGKGASEPFAYGIDECRVNAGDGPQLGFEDTSASELGFLRGSERDRLASSVRSQSSRIIVDESIGFIERHRGGPFLVNVWLNDTHATLDPDPRQLERYEHVMPPGVRHKHVGAKAVYYATVTEADHQIGRLLAYLENAGLRENTLVIFSADNGPEDISIRNASHSGVGSAGPFRGRKRSLYEGGIRVPCLVRWPAGGAGRGVVNNVTPVCGVDLLPTFCAMAGVDLPADLPLDGEDMSDVLRGGHRPRRTPLMWEWRFHIYGLHLHRSPMLAIRDGDWKLLINPTKDRIELYHIPNDPTELTNQADRQPAIVDRLTRQILDWHTRLPPGPRAADAGSNAYPWP